MWVCPGDRYSIPVCFSIFLLFCSSLVAYLYPHRSSLDYKKLSPGLANTRQPWPILSPYSLCDRRQPWPISAFLFRLSRPIYDLSSRINLASGRAVNTCHPASSPARSLATTDLGTRLSSIHLAFLSLNSHVGSSPTLYLYGTHDTVRSLHDQDN